MSASPGPHADFRPRGGADPGDALVVDDELSNRVLLRALLRRIGYRVTEAVDGEEAVERFRELRPDVVFMDIMMPRMDGYEATRRIKELSGDTFVPVIFLTAMTDEDALVRCVEVGGDDFLTKPFSHAILRSKIHAMERIRGLHREINHLYSRMRQEEEIAQEVFSSAVVADNVAMDVIRTRLQSADIFSGDLLLTANAPSGDLHVLLGDFTGHGLSAALGALPTAEVFRTMTAKGFSPEQILTAINRKLYALLPTGMFLAALFVRVSRELDHIQYCNCGLPPGMLIDGASGAIREQLVSAGLPLGIVGDIVPGELLHYLPVAKGDRVLLASDGVIEAHGPGGELFGRARLESAIAESAGRPFAIDAINRALDAFCGDASQADDISLAEVPCVPALLSVVASPVPTEVAAPVDEPGGDAEEGQDDWEVALAVTGRRLGRVDPVPLLINQIRELEGNGFEHSRLYTVLTELYVNALDHGVLRLDSSIKSDPEGFAHYFGERERRLESLGAGYVRFQVRRVRGTGRGRLWIRVEDSGGGFDSARAARVQVDETRLHGRGIRLLRALCESLEYRGRGNVAEAVFDIKGG